MRQMKKKQENPIRRAVQSFFEGRRTAPSVSGRESTDRTPYGGTGPEYPSGSLRQEARDLSEKVWAVLVETPKEDTIFVSSDRSEVQSYTDRVYGTGSASASRTPLGGPVQITWGEIVWQADSAGIEIFDLDLKPESRLRQEERDISEKVWVVEPKEGTLLVSSSASYVQDYADRRYPGQAGRATSYFWGDLVPWAEYAGSEIIDLDEFSHLEERLRQEWGPDDGSVYTVTAYSSLEEAEAAVAGMGAKKHHDLPDGGSVWVDPVLGPGMPISISYDQGWRPGNPWIVRQDVFEGKARHEQADPLGDKEAQLRAIVQDHQYGDVDGQMVDVTTARAILTVLDALSPERKETYLSMPVSRMADFAWKAVTSEGKVRHESLPWGQDAEQGSPDPSGMGPQGDTHFRSVYASREDAVSALTGMGYRHHHDSGDLSVWWNPDLGPGMPATIQQKDGQWVLVQSVFAGRERSGGLRAEAMTAVTSAQAVIGRALAHRDADSYYVHTYADNPPAFAIAFPTPEDAENANRLLKQAFASEGIPYEGRVENLTGPSLGGSATLWVKVQMQESRSRAEMVDADLDQKLSDLTTALRYDAGVPVSAYEPALWPGTGWVLRFNDPDVAKKASDWLQKDWGTQQSLGWTSVDHNSREGTVTIAFESVLRQESAEAEIWYQRKPMFGMGPAPDPSNLQATHVLLKTLPASLKPDEIFHQMQGEVWSPHGQARDLIRSKGLQHTSMSTGDVIRYPDGRVLLCAMAGWDVLDPGTVSESFLREVFGESEDPEDAACTRCGEPAPDGAKAGPEEGPWEWLCPDCLDAAIADAEAERSGMYESVKHEALQIRPHTYRGKEGFSLTGKPSPESGWPVKIFVFRRDTAEKIRDLLKKKAALHSYHDREEIDRLQDEINRLISSEGGDSEADVAEALRHESEETWAMAKGKTKTGPCEKCGKTDTLEPFPHPLVGFVTKDGDPVTWLCPSCWKETEEDWTAAYNLHMHGRTRTGSAKHEEWIGPVPQVCDLCGGAIKGAFIDGKTQMGPWATMCPDCHERYGVGLGQGAGQKYSAKDGKKLEAVTPGETITVFQDGAEFYAEPDGTVVWTAPFKVTDFDIKAAERARKMFLFWAATHNIGVTFAESRLRQEEEWEPEPGDYVLSPTGHLGGKTAVGIIGGRHLGDFNGDEDALAFVRDLMDRESFWPNIWMQDDHGGMTLLTEGRMRKQEGWDDEGRSDTASWIDRYILPSGVTQSEFEVEGLGGDDRVYEYSIDLRGLFGNRPEQAQAIADRIFTAFQQAGWEPEYLYDDTEIVVREYAESRIRQEADFSRVKVGDRVVVKDVEYPEGHPARGTASPGEVIDRGVVVQAGPDEMGVGIDFVVDFESGESFGYSSRDENPGLELESRAPKAESRSRVPKGVQNWLEGRRRVLRAEDVWSRPDLPPFQSDAEIEIEMMAERGFTFEEIQTVIFDRYYSADRDEISQMIRDALSGYEGRRRAQEKKETDAECPNCGGAGSISGVAPGQRIDQGLIDKPCPECGGTGRRKAQEGIFDGADVISSYGDAQAVSDGMLIPLRGSHRVTVAAHAELDRLYGALDSPPSGVVVDLMQWVGGDHAKAVASALVDMNASAAASQWNSGGVWKTNLGGVDFWILPNEVGGATLLLPSDY